MEKIELDKRILALIILGCLVIGGLIGATVSWVRRWRWVKKEKDENGTLNVRIGCWDREYPRSFWDFVWSTMWSLFWTVLLGAIMFKIIKWLIS